MTAVTDADLTIDQLAQRVGMTARNLREYQALGVLDPPERRGRVGYYGPAHVARVERIRELRAQGFTLELVRRTLAHGAGEDPLAHALLTPFQDEDPQPITRAELVARYGPVSDAALEDAVALGIVLRDPAGNLALPSPRLAQVADAMVGIGLGFGDMVRVARRMRPRLNAIAEIFVELFLDQVWTPFERSGQSEPAQLAELADGMRPMVLDTVTTHFKMAMDQAVGRAAAEAQARADRPTRRTS